MLGTAVDGADRLIAHDDRPDVALGLVDVLLDVKNPVLVGAERLLVLEHRLGGVPVVDLGEQSPPGPDHRLRSEEHTSELQSRSDLVCRLLLEKKKIRTKATPYHSAHGD